MKLTGLLIGTIVAFIFALDDDDLTQPKEQINQGLEQGEIVSDYLEWDDEIFKMGG